MRADQLVTQIGAERANGRDAHKNLVGAQLPFPFAPLPHSLLFFLLPLFRHFLPATTNESGEALKILSGSVWSPAAKRHLVIFYWKIASGEGNYSDNLFTFRLLTAQSTAPAGGRPVQPHHLAPSLIICDCELRITVGLIMLKLRNWASDYTFRINLYRVGQKTGPFFEVHNSYIYFI